MQIKHYSKILLTNLIISYLIIELIGFIAVKSNYIPANLPSFSIKINKIPPVADVNKMWGVWHIRNTITSMSIGDCFNVEYKANSYGCRDIERKVIDDLNRVIVLGDSFVEGLGVEENERFTNILEKSEKKQFLNFGCSGNFSTTQEYLVYEHLASKFSHSEVWIGVLPDNDFNDDDYELGKKVWYYHLRYKPYWVGNYPKYKLKYMQENLDDSYFTPEKIYLETNKIGNIFDRYLKSYTVWYNLYIFYKLKQVGAELSRSDNYSGYYDYSAMQLNNLKFSIEKIANKAKSKKIKVLLFPALFDFVRYQNEGKGRTKLYIDLYKFCKDRGVELVDLLPPFYDAHPKDFTDYYIACDRHWNVAGNKFIAELLKK